MSARRLLNAADAAAANVGAGAAGSPGKRALPAGGDARSELSLALLATIREALAAPASSPARQLLQVPN